MSVREAWQRGWTAVGRHPWLALIPLLWSLLQLGLAHAGLPVAPEPPAVPEPDFAPRTVIPPLSFLFLLPSWLPELQDLELPLQPALFAMPDYAAPWVRVVTQAGLAAGGASALGLYLVALDRKVRGLPLSPREAMARTARAVPALFVLLLASRLGGLWLTGPWRTGFDVIKALLFLAPVGVVIGRLPLHRALWQALNRPWERLDEWLLLGLRAILVTGPLMWLWWYVHHGWLYRSLGLLLYPFLATAILGAAVALYAQPEEMAPEPEGRSFWLWTAPLAAVGALILTLVPIDWARYAPIPEAALVEWPHVQVRHVIEEPQSRLIFHQRGSNLKLTRVMRERLGWRADGGHGSGWPVSPTRPVVAFLAALNDLDEEGRLIPGTSTLVLAGEVQDPRVAFIEYEGRRYDVQGQRFFILPVGGDSPWPRDDKYHPEIRVLDAAGDEVPEG